MRVQSTWKPAAGGLRLVSQRPKGELQALSALLGPVLKRCGLEKGLLEYRAVEAWPQVVGASIAANARATAIRKGVLYVDVLSSVWMQELGLLRERIVEQLNEHLQAQVVQRIVLSIDRGGYGSRESTGTSPGS